MPIVAIGVAAAAWGLGGAAAIGGVLAGTATLATALTAVATVGATLGAVGAVTGDKTLSTVGMVMGAVGGIGALAANAGIFGEAATTASLFGSDPVPMSVTAPDIAADASATSANDLSSLSTLPDLPGVGAETAATSGADALSGTGEFTADNILPTGAIDSATQAASGDAGGLINSSPGGNSLKSIVGQNVDDATNQVVPGSGGGTLPSGSPTDADSLAKIGSPAAPISDGVTAPPAPAVGGALPDVKIPGQTYQGADGVTYVSDGAKWTAQTSFWGSLMKSPMTQYGMLQAGGALISGIFDPLKPAQVDALNATAAANRAQAAVTSKQASNMNGALPIASRTPAPPAPPGGLINSPALAPVTGSVAA